MAEIVTVEINCPDAGSAAEIAEALVTRRLAAGASIHGEIASLYHWQGRIERRSEVPLVLKTRAELVPALVAAARALHPYETPAILSRPASVSDDYRSWLLAETAGPR